MAALGLTSAVALSAENGQESILRRALAEQRLHCAAESRPGFAEADGGLIYGLADDLCRAMAIAILGPSGDAEMRVPDADVDFEPLRDGSIDVGFVSAETIAGHRLAPYSRSNRLHRPHHGDSAGLIAGAFSARFRRACNVRDD